jgi:hypothetical protein
VGEDEEYQTLLTSATFTRKEETQL